MVKKSMAAANEKVSNYVPDEITYSILSKLSLKSLKRFECVQKSWSLLFENHFFMNMFRNNFLSNNNDPSSFILRDFVNYDEEVFYSFSGERFENNVQLDWSSSFENRVPTQTIKPLPGSEAQSIERCILKEDVGWVYCAVECYAHGFGYDPVINDYKVIRFVNVHLESSVQDMEEEMITLDLDRFRLRNYTGFDPFWEIYSLRSNSWRKLHVDRPYSLESVDDTHVYMDGVCHWLCRYYETVEPCLVSFYLSNEAFFKTPIPSYEDDCFDIKGNWIKLAVLNGSIALISYHEETTIFHISILGEFCTKESWTKLLIVGPFTCIERPIGVGMKGEIFFIRKDGELVWLDLSTQMIAELGYIGNPVHTRPIIIHK
ncbi:unnamed protein product [Trifolium pratense]|uniref:Uncharacterized protein n=1 Tax=Trifolium pratense TaxID=57577 RepID=A0ACB0L872_TRIPR|nr:unnamed protein product [Trifolium pratense]